MSLRTMVCALLGALGGQTGALVVGPVVSFADLTLGASAVGGLLAGIFMVSFFALLFRYASRCRGLGLAVFIGVLFGAVPGGVGGMAALVVGTWVGLGVGIGFGWLYGTLLCCLCPSPTASSHGGAP